MSDMSNSELMSLIAVGLGANKGFWMIQPRDDEGQWIEMGGTVLFRFRTGDGNLVVGNALGIYVGPTGKPGRARVLVKEGNKFGLKPGVHEMDSRNLTQVKAYLPEEGVEGIPTEGRVDKFGKPVKTLEDSQLPTVDELNQSVQEPTAEDERYSRGELTDEEKTAEQEARNESPIANMPAGFEAENPEEAKQLLRDAGVDVDGLDQPKQTRTEKPRAYGVGNFDEFRDLPDGAILDEYEQSQFYPSPEDYRGANGPVLRSFIKQDGKWFALGENDKPKGKPLSKTEIGDLLRTKALADRGAGSKVDENGNKVPAWADEVEPAGDRSNKEAEAQKFIEDAVARAKKDVEEGRSFPLIRNRPVANEAYLDAFDGKTPDLDELIKSESLALAREMNGGTQNKMPFEVVPGDTIVAEDGQEYQVLEVSGRGAGSVRFRLQTPDGSSGYQTVPSDFPVAIANRRQPARPARPARPAARPAEAPAQEAPTPETEAPETPEAEVPETPASVADDSGLIAIEDMIRLPRQEGTTPRNFPPSDRLDDGSEFELPRLSDDEFKAARQMTLQPILDEDGVPEKYVDEFGNLVEAEDPFGLMAALAKVYPTAKFTEDGVLILHRQKDKDGRIFELRANNSGKKAVVYTMRWTDPNTGEYKEYQHKDDRHSVKALFSVANGPEGLLDRLIGRVDRNGRDWSTTFKFANMKFKPTDSLFTRLKGFMSGTEDRKKMEELSDNALRLAEGRDVVLHNGKSAAAGTVKNSELPSLWSAFDEWFSSGEEREDRDAELSEDLTQVLSSIFGRAPLTKAGHQAYIDVLRKAFREKFPEVDQRKNRAYQAMLTNASRRMRGIYTVSASKARSIRYASADRVRPIEPGMVVEYKNNVDEFSTLKVVRLVQNVTATPGNLDPYEYGDFVEAVDSNGNSFILNAVKLKILRNQNTALTKYKKNLRGQALRDRRIEQGIFQPRERTSSPSQPRAPGAPETLRVPGTDSVLSDPTPEPVVIDDLDVGDFIYNLDGVKLGVISSIAPVTNRNGEEGVAFLYTTADGTRGQVAYLLGTELTPKKA